MSLKAHFDGRSIVLDEPATLAVGQSVRVLIDPPPARTRFADRIVSPAFARLPPTDGDTTDAISGDRTAAGDPAA